MLSGGCHRRFLTCHTHLHLCAHTINNRGGACKCGRLTNAHSQVDALCIPGRFSLASVFLPPHFRDSPAAAEFPLADDFPLLFNHPTSHVAKTPLPHAVGDYGFQRSRRQCPVWPWSSLAMPRCQRFSWPSFGARPEGRGGQQKSATKTQKNESFRNRDGINLNNSQS